MIEFHKYHGAGNDFIMIDNLKGNISLEPDYIKFLCDRHLGIGADGLILMEKSDKTDLSCHSDATADCFMNYYNSDGSLAEMCGNGIRCTAKFYQNKIFGSPPWPASTRDELGETGPTSKNSEININTRAGVKNIKINDNDTYSVNMGKPIFEHPDFPSAIGKAYGQIQDFNFNYVSMGNPHAVTFVDNLETIDLKNVGPKVENNSLFPNKINVEFVEKIDDRNYKVRVW